MLPINNLLKYLNDKISSREEEYLFVYCTLGHLWVLSDEMISSIMMYIYCKFNIITHGYDAIIILTPSLTLLDEGLEGACCGSLSVSTIKAI